MMAPDVPGMADVEQVNASMWDAYGAHHLDRATPLLEVDEIAWGPAGTGPGDAVFGDLRDLRVCDLGCVRAGTPPTSCVPMAPSWTPLICQRLRSSAQGRVT